MILSICFYFSGHYYSYIRNYKKELNKVNSKESTWFCLNDDRVTFVNWEEVKRNAFGKSKAEWDKDMKWIREENVFTYLFTYVIVHLRSFILFFFFIRLFDSLNKEERDRMRKKITEQRHLYPYTYQKMIKEMEYSHLNEDYYKESGSSAYVLLYIREKYLKVDSFFFFFVFFSCLIFILWLIIVIYYYYYCYFIIEIL
jgi:hypothetical protein